MEKRKAAAAKNTNAQDVRCGVDVREQMLDKTLADSFPASDPPSSIPDPSADGSVLPDEKAA